MSLPDRDNPYSFNEFLKWRDKVNYYEDDLFLKKLIKHFTGDEWEKLDAGAGKVAPKVSYRWRDIADSIAVPAKRPYMEHYDGHRNRIDRIVRPHELLEMEKEIFSEALFSEKTSPWLKFLKMFLIYQNGDACISCPVTCTEGLVELLKVYADSKETRQILRHCTEGVDGDFGIGSQFLSEIQGGSDVPANLLEAVQDGDKWRLYGTKFFCSAAHADYAVVTAKPAGSEKVALFIVPAWLPGNKDKEIRNNYTIDRIKWKMGTSELPTAEITYNGSEAYQVGPLDRGVAVVVGVVLTFSRLTVGLASAAMMTRVVREAKKYSEFRSAFGLNINRFPMVEVQMRKIEKMSQQSTAGAFKVYAGFLELDGGLQVSLNAEEPQEVKQKRFDVRILILLQKITTTWDATDTIRMAMSIFGGHGVMEDFSFLPRAFRDAAINELWEGPRNVLLAQIHRDFQKASAWYSPGDFVASTLEGADKQAIEKYGAELTELVNHKDLFTMEDKNLEICERLDRFCHDFFHTYQELALQEVNDS